MVKWTFVMAKKCWSKKFKTGNKYLNDIKLYDSDVTIVWDWNDMHDWKSFFFHFGMVFVLFSFSQLHIDNSDKITFTIRCERMFGWVFSFCTFCFRLNRRCTKNRTQLLTIEPIFFLLSSKRFHARKSKTKKLSLKRLHSYGWDLRLQR